MDYPPTRVEQHPPQQHRIVHPFRDERALLLQLLPQLLKPIMLDDRQVPQHTGKGLIIRVCNTLWHRTGAGLLWYRSGCHPS